MRKLTREEVTAMWLYGEAYARSGLSAVGWWQSLDGLSREAVLRFLRELDAAVPAKRKPGGYMGRSPVGTDG